MALVTLLGSVAFFVQVAVFGRSADDAAVAVGIAIVVLGYLAWQVQMGRPSEDRQIEELRAERREIKERLQRTDLPSAEQASMLQQPAPDWTVSVADVIRETLAAEEKRRRDVVRQRDIRDTIQLGLNQLEEYYQINKGQARNSFAASIGASSIGMLTLLAAAWIVFANHTEVAGAAIAALPGILLQFIGGAHFYMYRKALTQMNGYFEQLVRMQDTMLSIHLWESLPESEHQQVLGDKLIMAILQRTMPSEFARAMSLLEPPATRQTQPREPTTAPAKKGTTRRNQPTNITTLPNAPAEQA